MLLHFAAIVITFCGDYYILRRNNTNHSLTKGRGKVWVKFHQMHHISSSSFCDIFLFSFSNMLTFVKFANFVEVAKMVDLVEADKT